MLQKLVIPIALFSGALGGGTITFFSKNVNEQNKNSNNLVIYKDVEGGSVGGKIVIGNSLSDKLKTKKDQINIVGFSGEKWKRVDSGTSSNKKNKNTLVLLGKESGGGFFDSALESVSWLWGGRSNNLGINANWKDMTNGNSPSEQTQKKKNSSTVYVKGLTCDSIKNGKKIKQYFQNGGRENNNISVSCQKRNPISSIFG
ncbi:hypothetical protein [Mycoplasma suis]|uniref:Uncharacterized protein n=1 Tax=Mycoplasma suis (strain Illinois) TaxID=768700 RepID=F0QQV6_MYCSL|nr:hypothetical protein [Mycoplasma suis]ADX97876.1 hypothetical protein MSU_0334 [Mycoplasma suis str. Illinois]